MRIVWDAPKPLANLAKHRLDFADLETEFDFGTALVTTTQQSRAGRERFRVIGKLGSRVLTIIVSPLGTQALAIVSLRAANPREGKFDERNSD